MPLAKLVPFNLVRIRQLLQPLDDYDGWKVNQRPPAIGDVGAIVEVLHAAGHADRYVVECLGPDGVDIWLTDFLADELEPIPDP